MHSRCCEVKFSQENFILNKVPSRADNAPDEAQLPDCPAQRNLRQYCSQVTSSDAERSKAEELREQGHEVVETKWSYAGG